MPEETKKEAPKAAASTGSDDSKLFGALCYIIGVLVPLFVLFTDKKENKFLVFHAWQSLIISAVFIVLSIPLGILFGFLSFTTGILGLCVLPFYFVPLLLLVFLAYKAYQGEKYMLPVIGEFALKQVK